MATQYPINHVYNEKGKKETIDTFLSGPMKDVWVKSISNEYGRLTQGNKYGVKCTDCFDFILKNEVPQGRDVTYASFCFDYRPLKGEKYRARMVVGGNSLSYDEDPGSPAASLLEIKLLINSTISDADKGARFFSCVLKDFFLKTFMSNLEYIKLLLKNIPHDIIDKYDLQKIQHNGYVYAKIKKACMVGSKRQFWHLNSSANALNPMGTSKSHIHLECGITPRAKQDFVYVSMTSE